VNEPAMNNDPPNESPPPALPRSEPPMSPSQEPLASLSSAQALPSFSPILSEHSVGRFEFLHRRPTVSTRIALVFGTLRKGYVVFGPGRPPTLGELLWTGIRTVYEVDLGLHHTNIRTDLPSAGDAFPFHAEIDVQWRVTDPYRVVVDGIKDVREALTPRLLARLRGITRKFMVEDAEEAERVANDAFDAEPIGLEFGLTVQAVTRLEMDAQTVEYAGSSKLTGLGLSPGCPDARAA
jgi:hypothetical protein